MTSELVLTYGEGRWRARGVGLDVSHAELAALEREIERRLGARGGPERVTLRFDFDSLPRALRQYHSHYCNYSLRIGGARGA